MAPTDYELLAPSYDRRYRQNDYSGVEAALLSFVDSAAGAILEVGCGTGHWLRTLASRGAAVAGVDPSEGMLARARLKLPGARLAVARAEGLPFADGTFARVFCVNALHHFDDPASFFVEAYRVLRSGGKVLTVGLDPHTGLDRWCIYDFFPETRANDERRYSSTESIRDRMRRAGFASQDAFVAQHLPLRVPARKALAEGLLDKATTSQLADLDDETYAQGLHAMERAAAVAEGRGETLELVADLRLWATVGART